MSDRNDESHQEPPTQEGVSSREDAVLSANDEDDNDECDADSAEGIEGNGAKKLFGNDARGSIASALSGTALIRYHREILSGLLLQSPGPDLDRLATQAGVSVLNENDHRNRKRARSEGHDALLRGNTEAITSVPALEPFFPLALSTSCKSAPRSALHEAPVRSTKNGLTLKRSDFKSVCMSELEANVRTKFESSDLGQEAIASENTQYSWFFQKTGKELPVSTLMSRTTKFTTLALVYNECSMSAFAKWAFRSKGVASNRGLLEPMISVPAPGKREHDFPSPTAMFRVCFICQHFGHYELECEELLGHRLLSTVAGEVMAYRHLQQLVKSAAGQQLMLDSVLSKSQSALSRACQRCKSYVPAPFRSCSQCDSTFHCGCLEGFTERKILGEWLCPLCEKHDQSDTTVDLEGCEGFVIEQRKLLPHLSKDEHLSKSLGIDFSDRSWSRVVSVVDGKELSSVVATLIPDTTVLPTVGRNQKLTVGEFCWAKREHAPEGSLGRDEWWPAQVISIISNKGNYFSMDVTPYLVKLLGGVRANRARASATIPFFQNFRSVAYKRLLNRTKSFVAADEKFETGVTEAIRLMGFKSIDHVLVHADAMLEIHENLPHHQASSDDEFTTFKQDGFVIRARLSDIDTVDSRVTLRKQIEYHANDSDNPAQVYSRTRLVGSLVAWMSLDQSKVCPHVGTVLVANVETKMALVSPIPEWETKLRPARSKSGVVVHCYPAQATEWISMNKLHMICNGPGPYCQEAISREVVTKLVSNARMDAVAEEEHKALLPKQMSADA